MKKVLCLLLAALMLLSVCACGHTSEDDTPKGTTPAGTSGEVSEQESRESLDIPDTRYEGVEFTFLTRDAGEWSTVDILPEDETLKDNISAAVYERNELVRDKYGIIVKEIKTADSVGSASKEVSAATGDFIAIISQISDACSMLNNGYLTDMNSDGCVNLDLEKPWWDRKLVENMTIDGHTYFATGDLLTSDNDGTFAILFNKSLVKDCQLPDIYELVNNKQWTMDKMYEFEQLAVNDKDGNGKLDYDSDTCGFAYTGDTPYSMLYAGGVSIITRDEEGSLVYSLDIERTANISEKVQLILTKDYALDMNTVTSDTVVEVGKKCFGENHCLFFGECLQCVTRIRSYDVDFGIIPYPKYDELQDNYYSVMEWVGCVVSIPRSVSTQIEMVSSMLEAMAYYSVDTLTQQYYEINLKTKLAKDEQSGPMLDLILENRIYDLAYTFRWSSVVDNLAATMRPGGKASVASASKKYEQQLMRTIDQLIRKIEKIENK